MTDLCNKTTDLRPRLRRILKRWTAFGLVLLALFAVIGFAQVVWEITGAN